MSKCTEVTTDKLRVLEENRRKFVFANPAQISMEITQVDGCLFTDSLTERCDYAGRVNGIEFYIELKGKNVTKGVKQLESTIKRISRDVKKLPKKSFVICSKSAPGAQASLLTAKKRFKKSYNSSLLIKQNQYTEKVS